MAIFSSNNSGDNSSKPDTNTTIFTAGSKIKGEITLTCSLYIDGEFSGIINSENQVIVGKNGKVKGDIITNRLIVQGFVDGNINADIVEIKADGTVHGSIESTELIIESQAHFEGSSILKGNAPALEKTKDTLKLNKA